MSDTKEDPRSGLALSDGPVRNPDLGKIRQERENRKYLRPWLSHTLSRKNLMALTGLFLCFFLVIHLFGNLQLLLPAEAARWQFNFYSKLLSENLFILLISYVLFASILASCRLCTPDHHSEQAVERSTLCVRPTKRH